MSTDLPESSEVWRLPEDTSAVLQIFFRETYFSKWLLFVLLGLVLIFVIFTGEWNNVVSKMEAYGADRNLLLGQRAVNMIEALHRRKRALLVPPGHVVEHHNSLFHSQFDYKPIILQDIYYGVSTLVYRSTHQ